MRKLILLAVLFLIFMVIGAVSAEGSDLYLYKCSTGTATKIINDPNYVTSYDIWGNRVVWTNHQNDDFKIYQYEINTGKQKKVNTDMYNQTEPALWDDLLVYLDNGRSTSESDYRQDIILYNLKTNIKTVITKEPVEIWYTPSINDNRIVWSDNRTGKPSVYLYDLKTGEEQKISTGNLEQSEPAIYGDIITWNTYFADESSDIGESYDIYMYNIKTGKTETIAKKLEAMMHPPTLIWGDLIVYGNNVYNITSKKTSRIPGAFIATGIYNQTIVGEERKDNYDVYIYDLKSLKKTKITTGPSEHIYPKIYGDYIIWEQRKHGDVQ